MTLNYRKANVTSISDILSEINTEATALGCTVNYHQGGTSTATTGIHFTINDANHPGSDRAICFEYGVSTSEEKHYQYITGGVTKGYNAADGNDYSDQPWVAYDICRRFTINHIGTSCELHIFSQASPFVMYLALYDPVLDWYSLMVLANLEPTPGDTREYTIAMANSYMARDAGTREENGGLIFRYDNGHLCAIFPGGNNGTASSKYNEDGEYGISNSSNTAWAMPSPFRMLYPLMYAPRISGGHSLALPIPIYVKKMDLTCCLLGHMPKMLMINPQGRAHGEQITINSKSYIVCRMGDPNRADNQPYGCAFEVAGS